MSITINFSPADMQSLREYATHTNISVEEFSRQAVIKELHNISYRKKLDKAFDNMANGKWEEHELIEVENA